MNVRCSGCQTVYRVDPAKVPEGGVRARCDRCDAIIFVEPEGGLPELGSIEGTTAVETAPLDSPTADESPISAPEADPERARVAAASATEFGKDDPHTRARRLATALISDIKAYYPDRWRAGLERGSVREDLREEIRKSWDEYTLQVGDALARSTSYFRDALNQILGEGRRLF